MPRHTQQNTYTPSDITSATDVGQLSPELRGLLRAEKNRTNSALPQVFESMRDRLAAAIPAQLQHISVSVDFFKLLFLECIGKGNLVDALLQGLSEEELSALSAVQLRHFLISLVGETEESDFCDIPLPQLRLLFKMAREGKLKTRADLTIRFIKLKKDEEMTHEELVMMIRNTASFIAEAPLQAMREEDLRDVLRLIRANRISGVRDFMRFRKERRALLAQAKITPQPSPDPAPIVQLLDDTYIPTYSVSDTGEVLTDDSGAFPLRQNSTDSNGIDALEDTDEESFPNEGEGAFETEDADQMTAAVHPRSLRHAATFGSAFVALMEEQVKTSQNPETGREKLDDPLFEEVPFLPEDVVPDSSGDAFENKLQGRTVSLSATDRYRRRMSRKQQETLDESKSPAAEDLISAEPLDRPDLLPCEKAIELFSATPVQWIELSKKALMRLYVDETENWKETVIAENPKVFANADVIEYVLSEPLGAPVDMESARSAFYGFMVTAKKCGDTQIAVELTYIRSPESLEREMNSLLHLVGGLCYNLPDEGKADEIVCRCETFLELANIMEELLRMSIDLVQGEGRAVKKVLPFYHSLLRKMKTGNFFGCLFAPPGQEEKYGTGQAYRVTINTIPDAPSATFRIRRTVGLVPQLLLIKDLISKHGELEIVKKLSDEVDLLSGNINPRMTEYLTASRNSMLFQHQTALKVTGSRFLKDHIQGVLYYPNAIDFFTAAMRQKTFQVLWLNNCPPSGEVENVGFYMVDMGITSINPFGNGDDPAEIMNNRSLLALSLLGEGKIFRTHDEYLEAFPLLGAQQVNGPDKNLRYIQWSPSADSFCPLLDDDDVLSSIQPPRKQSVTNTATKARDERLKAAANCQKYEIVPGFRRPSRKKGKTKKTKRKKGRR